MEHLSRPGFSVEQAVRQWGWNHEYWASRPAFASLDPYLDPALKAIRDHDDFTLEGVSTFTEKVAAYASIEEHRDWSHEDYAKIGKKLAVAQEAATRGDGDPLFDALYEADMETLHVVGAKELAIMGKYPQAAAAFTKEVLVTNPPMGDTGIPEDDYDKHLKFDNPRQQTLFAIVIRGRLGTQKPCDVIDWMEEPLYDLNNQSPREVILWGDHTQREALLTFVRATQAGIYT